VEAGNFPANQEALMGKKLMMKMGLLLIFALAAELASGCHWPRPEPPPSETLDPASDAPAPVKLHQAFSLAKVRASGNGMVIDPWRLSTEVVPKEKVRIAVVASWCGASHDYIRTLSGYSNHGGVDLIVFYEDEADRMLDIQLANREITEEQRAEVAAEFESRNQVLVDPGAVRTPGLDFYLISAGEFRGLVTKYPTLIRCDPAGCALER
jgi:hypothetical protein